MESMHVGWSPIMITGMALNVAGIWVTCLVLSIALVIGTMKPLTLGFVMPGMADEYGMSIADVAMLQAVALIGTVVGPVIWGWGRSWIPFWPARRHRQRSCSSSRAGPWAAEFVQDCVVQSPPRSGFGPLVEAALCGLERHPRTMAADPATNTRWSARTRSP